MASEAVENGSVNIQLFNEAREGYAAIGFLSKDLNGSPFHQKDVFRKLIKDPKKYRSDGLGRTPFHNMVSIDLEHRRAWDQGDISQTDYTKIIQCLSMSSYYDVDCQDSKGQTALHYAVHFGNYNGIIGLLKNGADINIADETNLSPLAYAWKYSQKNAGTHGRVIYELEKHLYKLQLYGIHISDLNKELFRQDDPLNFRLNIHRGCKDEEVLLKRDPIDEFFTGSDFLSDNVAIVTYPTMTRNSRGHVHRFFRINSDQFYEKYPNLAEVLKLQFNKACTRMRLIKDATASLKKLMNVKLSDECVNAILRFLANYELKKLISMMEVQGPPNERRRLS